MQPNPPETVILIDDSTFDNTLHRRAIASTGLVGNVLTFSVADEALAYLRTAGSVPADLILLDINMPRMDGFAFLDAATKEFGERFDTSAVVMLTTSVEQGDQKLAETHPAVRDYLLKPLTAEKFAALHRAIFGTNGRDNRVA